MQPENALNEMTGISTKEQLLELHGFGSMVMMMFYRRDSRMPCCRGQRQLKLN